MGGMLNSGALTFTHSYMVMFLSTECGLSAGESALVAAGAILAPILGFVADNFYSTAIGRKFGRRRFWILLAIPMMIAEPLIFTVTPFGFPYYFALYIIYNVAYTFVTANLAPLTIEMTDDYQERTYLTGYKHIFGNVAGFLMATLVGFGFGVFGETNPFSYFIIASINAAVMAISLIAVYCSTWEHSPEEVAQEKIEGVGQAIKKLVIDVLSTFRNRSFRKVLAPYLFMKLAAACWSACLSFFIVYSLGIPKSYESVMEMPGKIVAIVCTVVWVAWMAKKGFHTPWYVSTLGAAGCIVAYNFFAFGRLTGFSTVEIAMIAYPVIFASGSSSTSASNICSMCRSTTSPTSTSSSRSVAARASTARPRSSASRSSPPSPRASGDSRWPPPASSSPLVIPRPSPSPVPYPCLSAVIC
mgnify:CR=1 FL=1